MTRRQRRRGSSEKIPQYGFFPKPEPEDNSHDEQDDLHEWLDRLSYFDALRWALGPDGKLERDRLRQVATARGYWPEWVDHKEGKTLGEVRDEIVDYAQKKKREREEEND
jgi:hypothetical protein